MSGQDVAVTTYKASEVNAAQEQKNNLRRPDGPDWEPWASHVIDGMLVILWRKPTTA